MTPMKYEGDFFFKRWICSKLCFLGFESGNQGKTLLKISLVERLRENIDMDEWQCNDRQEMSAFVGS